MITLGSLFDGAGGFPYAAALAGITPIWASELEPFPIRVTTKRFPEMKHLGDITKINGREIEPVDIITFGSPCQDMSIAGKQKGLSGERSGLFHEAIRIIKEMREATNGVYPRYIVWENVKGAKSSNKGKDFQTVLEEIAKIKDSHISIPRPHKGKWANAGSIVGGDYSISWRLLDAQFWGVPQRRERFYLIADLGGKTAPKIQFERESLLRYFKTGGKENERTTGDIDKSVEAASGTTFVLNDQGGKIMSVSENKTATLRAEEHGHQPIVFEPGIASRDGGHIWENGITGTLRANMGDNQLSICSAFNGHKSITASICYKEERSPCIETKMPPNVLVLENHPNDSRVKLSGDVVQTLSSRMGTGGNNTPMVLCIQGNTINRSDNAGAEGKGVNEDVSFTLNTADHHAVAYDCRNHTVNTEISATLQAKNGGGHSLNYINPIAVYPHYIVRRLTPLECCRLQGFPDFWCDNLETPNPTEKELDFWENVFETHRKATNPKKKPKTRKYIRKWLENPYSDSAMYKIWGNSIAIPCAYTVLAGIAEEMRKECA